MRLAIERLSILGNFAIAVWLTVFDALVARLLIPVMDLGRLVMASDGFDLCSCSG